MNKITRRLLSGASFAALALGLAPTGAQAAGLCPEPLGAGFNGAIGTACITFGDPATATGAKGTHTFITATIGAASSVDAFAFDTFFQAPGAAANALAIGVEEVVSETAKFTNNGGTVEAWAVATGASTFAGAFAAGVVQVNSGAWGGSAFNTVNNTGVIEAFATAAVAKVGNGAEVAIASAAGIIQVATAAFTNLNSLINSGLVEGVANAAAFGSTAIAAAIGIGIEQAAAGGTTNHNFISNSGSIVGIANAVASATVFTAHASDIAAGAFQLATGTSAHNTVNNGNLIRASANASAHGTWAAVSTAAARAQAVGIEQIAAAFSTAVNVVNNSGLISASAQALADPAWSVTATATATGVKQSAIAGGTAANVVNNNGGAISAFASASAWGASLFTASANAHAVGVNQHASGLSAFNTVHNNAGLIAATARAFASSAASAADAYATATGVNQVATAAWVAADFVSNSGLISVNATANAVNFTTPSLGGAGSTASANAHAVGVHQSAFGTSAFATVNNNGGVISVHAAAHAHSASTWASAFATATGIHQLASGTWAHANVFNSGLINVGAKATASFAVWASAAASARGVVQSAFAFLGVTAHANLTNANSGVIAVGASANAHNAAVASAFATATGVHQSATALLGLSAGATLLNTVNAVITVGAGAHATSASFANAGALAIGVTQRAAGASVNSNSVINNGVIAVGAAATATAVFVALAKASAGGVLQFATSGTTNINSLVNNTSAFIHVSANAFAGATFTAKASALALGVRQGAHLAFLDTNAMTNNGHLTVSAHATAVGVFATGSALAIAAGVIQSASIDALAFDHMSNAAGAAINVNATANAFAPGGLLGHASASAFGILQRATGAWTAAATFNNSGTLHVSANASATGFLVAAATASAFGVSQFVTAGTAALASVVNNNHITVKAHAFASFGTTDVAVVSAQGIFQTAVGGVFAQAFVSNVGNISVTDTATAIASPTFGAIAVAIASAGGISQFAIGGSTALATVINSGVIDPAAFANAYGWFFAGAAANAVGINQFAAAGGGIGSLANVNVVNNGIINVTAVAVAKAVVSGVATATAIGITQSAVNASFAIANVTNAGTINVQAKANAHGGVAIANAFALGVGQVASAFNGGPIASLASNNFINTSSGILNVLATASAHGGVDIPRATAVGVAQSAFAPSGAWTNVDHVLNTTNALINVSAHAVASIGNAAGFGAGSTERALAIGITQFGGAAGFPSVFIGNAVTNNGVINVSASAIGIGGEWANVRATALGVGQRGVFAGLIVNNVFNNGSLLVNANAVAKTTQDFFGATAVANAHGVNQTATATTFGLESVGVTNASSGVFQVHAHAQATGHSAGFALFSSALAFASAVGVSQSLWGASAGLALANFHNNGSFDVQASATAKGGFTNAAFAFATGVNVFAWTEPLGLSMVNSGLFHVEAHAAGSGLGVAIANGINVTGFGTVFGTIANFGKMSVTANAAGAAFGTAFARGIGVFANTFTGLVSNTGSLYVRAIGNAGEFVGATGIAVFSGAGPGLIVNNSGTIYAGISNNSGTTFQRGTAINTLGAPNAMSILLEGSAHGTGHVYGNIFIATSDNVVVENGKTCFNGVINSATLLNNGFLYASAAGGVVNPLFPVGILNGTLTIVGGAAAGTLVLVNDTQQGAAAAYVANFSEQAGGDLVLEMRGLADGPGAGNLGGDGGPTGLGFLPVVGKIVAGTSAFLHGALELQPYAGLYTSTKVQVVSAGHINGQFTAVISHSLFLSGTVSNNANLTIDTLSITRNPFNSFGGTHNQNAVATGIEGSYAALYGLAASGTPMTAAQAAYAKFVGSLFLIGPGAAGVAEFNADLQQLSGVEYGEQAKAQLTSTRILYDTIGTHLQVISEGSNDSVGQLISGVSPAAGGTGIGKGNIWVSAYGDWGTTKGSSTGPQVKVTDRGLFVGADFDIDQWTKVGLVGGKTSGVTHFRGDNGNHGDYNGWHLGIYGRYDMDPWYVEGVLSYATFTNDMVRNIFIQPSQAGLCCNFPFSSTAAEKLAATTSGATGAHYDSHTYGAHGEVGYRLDTGSAIDLTPYLAFSWMHADSDTFHETGLPGVDLTVNDAAANSFASFLGARFSTDWQLTDHMAISPILRLAWEHEWDGTAWSASESFFPAPLNSHFKVTGKGARDFASVGLGASVNISSRVEATLGYEGRWSSNEKDNALLGHVNIHF